MKKILLLATFGLASMAYSQVIIGDDIGTATVKNSVLLEFAKQNKGLVLPAVRTIPVAPTEGTILLDATQSGQARVKFFNGAWVDLSGANGDISQFLALQPTMQQVTETLEAKTVIGNTTSSADGVLVLESTTKAMVLPTVLDVNDIPSPAAGMMVYVNKTGAKRLAVFNGTVWSFWKP